MAVRKKACTPNSDCAAEPAGLPLPDKELQFKKESSRAIKTNVAREWAKGVLIPLVAIAGVSMLWRFSESDGIRFWFASVVFLILMAIGFAFATEFIKSLVTGDLLKQTVVVVKEAVMKEWMRVFLAFLAIGAGISIVLTASQLDYYLPGWVLYCLALILIAGGITFFWTRSKFYKG
jgi:hypothetical protein